MEDYVFSVTDGDHQAPPKVSKGIPFLVISNIADGSLDFSNTRYVPEEYYEKIQMERKPKRGDILFSVTGSYGIVVNIKTDRLFCFQRHIGLIKPTISNEYLSFVLMSNYIKSLCDKLATGTAQKTVGLDTLRSLYVPIAPIEEQERIVAKIKHLLLQISFLEAGKGKLVAAIKQAKSKILDLAIHGKLVPQDPNDEPASELLKRINPKAEITCDNPQYGKLPKGWCETLLGNIGNWQSGATPSRLRKDYYNGDIPWLKTGDLNDSVIKSIPETITRKALKETSVKLNPTGSVLIAMYGATIGKIGILALPATTNQACCACVDYMCDKMFLFYFLLANRKRFVAMGGGGAQPNISKEKITNTHIPLPPLSEQHRIVAKIEELFVHFDKIESSLQA